MNSIRLSAIVLVFFLAAHAYAQDSFMVLSVKGKVEYSTSKSAKWKKLQVGKKLKSKDRVRTSFASYAKFMMNQQRIVSVDENTTKKLGEFLKTRGKSGGSATSKILKYAARQIERSKEDRGGGSTFGAVRGGMDVFNAVFPKYSVITMTPTFRWVDADSTSDYELILLNEKFEVIGVKELPKGKHQYIAEPELVAGGNTYHWRVTRNDDGEISDIQTFTVLPADTIAFINGELEQLDTELESMGADAVTKHLIRAIYFENRGLYSDAFFEYRTTIRLAPEVDEYREMMRSLLLTLRLYNEEEYLLK